MIGDNLPFLLTEPQIEADLPTLATIMQNRRNQFMRVVWHSNQNKSLQKKGPGAEYKNKEVRKLYVATVRNDFNFEQRVRKILETNGQAYAAVGWQAQPRTWGEHVKKTPFVIHENVGDDLLERLYANFLPVRWWDFAGITGYYVDGVKVPNATIEALRYARKEAVGELAKARYEAHPVNTRLDNVVAMFVAGRWYKIAPPTAASIEALANLAKNYAAAA